MTQPVPLACAAVLLAGCTSLHVMSHVPFSTISRLSALKLADVEPSELRLAARLPEVLEPRAGGVKVRIVISSRKQDGKATEEYVLERADEPAELALLLAQRRAGYRLWVYRLTLADADRLRNSIAKAGAASAVSIAAGVDACHRTPLGSTPLPTTTFLRIGAEGFFVLAEDLDLRAVVSEQELASYVPPCE